VFEAPALQVGIELLLDVGGQGIALFGQVRDERRVVLLHRAVELRLFGAVARVGEATGGFPAVGVHRHARRRPASRSSTRRFPGVRPGHTQAR